jgi:hypothetical protein
MFNTTIGGGLAEVLVKEFEDMKAKSKVSSEATV